METDKSRKIVIAVIGRDQVGIVAKVATVLAENAVNIEDISQKVFSGDVFAMTLMADITSSSLDLPGMTEKLERALDGMGLKVALHDAELFQYMHRV
ncbi:MAG: ACT domain-containing protein [Deltaproteobacteria bacterium]|nr:MAG: ACT domain-containing protein [Deltaproteobacteria bacterium]